MNASEMLALDRAHVFHPYSTFINPPPVFPVKSARGVRLTLTDGRELIPLLTGRLKADREFEVRIAVADELGAMGPAGATAVPALREAQRDPQIKVRDAAATAIKLIQKPAEKPKK